MCKTGKKEFDTIFDAQIRINQINPNKEANKPNRSYKCEYCNKYHLTKISHESNNERNRKIGEKVKKREENFIKRETEYYTKKFRL